MKRKPKILLAVILSVLMIFTAFPVTAASPTAILETQNPTTLKNQEASQDSVTKQEPYVVSEVVEKREPNIKHFRMSDGSYVAAVYPHDVHYEDVNGSLQDINNSLSLETDNNTSVLANKSNIMSVKFMKKSNPNKLYTIKKGEHNIKVSIDGVSTVNAVEYVEEESLADDKFALKNIGSRVTYTDILNNTDIELTLKATELKENIILKDKPDFSSLLYTYHLNSSVTAIQKNAKNIDLVDKDNNLIFNISAPIIQDAEGNYYEDLILEIIETKNSKITVKLNWSLPDNIKYPVIIDPVMSFTTDRLEIQDTFILSSSPTQNYDYNAHLNINNNGYILLRFPTPSLKTGDKITNAQLYLTPYVNTGVGSNYSNENSYSPPLYINAHKILRTWEETTATYQNVSPDSNFYDNLVQSTFVVSENDTYCWDITQLANEWVEEYSENYGILLKYNAPPSDGSTFNAYFCSSNSSSTPSQYYPQILYSYVSTNGIENHFSYQIQNLGHAGTGYVNNLTGNLTIVNPIFSTSGSLTPITVSLVYNTQDVNQNITPYGNGWWLNWAQKIDWSVGSEFVTYGQYIKYTDGDGTDHYFTTNSATGIWTDEINPDRKIYYIGSTGDYKMTDNSGTEMFFKRNGEEDEWFLYKVQDVYNNCIYIDLNPNNLNQVEKVRSSSGASVDFAYTQYGFLDYINYQDGTTTKTITIDYNNHSEGHNNCISDITFADGTTAEYHYYGSTPYISKAKDIDGQFILYNYKWSVPLRTNYIADYSNNSVKGSEFSALHAATSTTYTDIINNRKYLYTFAQNGTLKSVIDITASDGNGYGQYYEYNYGLPETNGTDNLTSLSKTQKSAVNLLKNHSFESDNITPSFQVWGETSGTSTHSICDTESYIGGRSFSLYRHPQSNSSRVLGFFSQYLYANKTYTLSAYVNTKDMQPVVGGASLYVNTTNGSYESECISQDEDKWQRLSVTFTPTVTGTTSLCMSLRGVTGTVYFDNIQLEEGDLSDYNLLENAGFEFDTSASPYGWYPSTNTGSISETHKAGGTRALYIYGEPEKTKHYYQIISVPDGKSGDTYVMSAFSKGNAAASGGYKYTLMVRFLNNGSIVKQETCEFNSYTTEWQKIAGAAKATGNYDTIQFWLLYYNNCNSVYFDNAQLIKDTFGNTYTYDDNGNLENVVNLEGKETYTFSYDGNNQLINQTTLSGSKIDYDYNDTVKQQLDSVTAGGVKTEFTYDSFGNTLTSTTHSNGSVQNPKIISSATYSENGEYTESVTDSRGNTTQFDYNENRGLLNSTTNAKGIITGYEYYPNELLKKVQTGSSAVNYSYDTAKRLSAITSPSDTVYSFTYNNFGRNTSVKLGQRTLSSFVYDNQKGLLNSATYGNGTVVNYTYDHLGRLTTTSFDQTPRYKNVYDGASRLIEASDLQTGLKHKYEYDILNRFVKEKIIDVSSPVAELKFSYDNSRNRLSGQKVTVKDTVINTEYVYSSSTVTPDLISAIKQNDSNILSYGYDNLNRLSTRTLATTTPFVTEYSYLAGKTKGSTTNDSDLTTTLVHSLLNGNNVLIYSYDDLGNITSVKNNNVVTESYTYDNLNQLKTATLGNDIWEYTYDNGGNILSAKKNGITKKTYIYANSEWTDLLTAYNGETIIYDEIGNPISYRDDMNFTWCEGNRLSTATHGTNSYTYNYNQDGLRVNKVGKDVATDKFTYVDFYWLNGKLQGERVDSRYTVFLYDQNGNPYGFFVKDTTANDYYYYVFNAQGDVIGILDSNGTYVVEYTYNPWGEILSITGTLADTIGQQNPLRYRCYYYDNETGLYYVSGRYYDPEIGRFISANNVVSCVGEEILAHNMYAYCFNNPVNLAEIASSTVQNISNSDYYASEIIPADITTLYNVPLYNQNGYSLCWAFCQVMVEDFQNGIIRTNAQATERAIAIAKSIDSKDWNRGQWPTNSPTVSDNAVFASGINTLYDLYSTLVKNGPIYGYYKGENVDAHLIVITGVNLTKGTVHTNNPWNFIGEQTYSDFLTGFAWNNNSTYPMPFYAYLPII